MSGVAKLFDPLGLISPIIVKAKFTFQEVCQNNLNCVDIVPYQKWLKFIETIKHINLIQNP